MKRSTIHTIKVNGILNGSVRISRPDWSRKFRIRHAIIIMAMMVLCFFTVRGPHGNPDVPLPYVILAVDVVGVLCIRNMGDLDYGIELIPFIVTVVFGILMQVLLAGGYYRREDAISAFVLLFAMVVCVLLIAQKGYSATVWKLISATNILASGCIIVQMAAKAVGIRLDHLGTFSDWFFNAWDFADGYRPCGIFLEPAMYAQLALLALYDTVFLRPSRWRTCITALALFLCTSSLALLGLAALALVYILFLDTFTTVPRRTKYIVWGITATVVLLSWGWLLTADIYALDRALTGSSMGVRFLRSVDLFGLLSPLEKVFGIGLQNQQLYLNYHSIVLAHDTYETIRTNREFASVLGYLPCTTGLIGLVTFIFPFYRVFRKGGLRTKIMVGLFIYVCLFCCILSNCIFVLYMLAVYSAYDMERRMVSIPKKQMEEPT